MQAMFDLLKTLLSDPGAAETAPGKLTFELAVAALLIEVAAQADGISPVERDAVKAILGRQFSLTPAEAETLLNDAARAQANAPHLLRFTRAIKDGMPLDERERLIEWLWEVVYADGQEHDLEAALMRRLAGLIYVPDQASGGARKRVRRRLGLEA